MIESTAANFERHFTDYLARVEQGETIRISHEGRIVARITPDFDFMPGPQAVELFKGHRADPRSGRRHDGELRTFDLERK